MHLVPATARWPALAGIEKPARAARMGTSDRPPDVVGYVPTVEEALQLLKMLAHVRLVCRRKGWPSLTTSRAWWIAAAALRECQADVMTAPTSIQIAANRRLGVRLGSLILGTA